VNNLEGLAKMKNLIKKDAEEIMSFALKSIGDKTYDKIYYNCEYFVTECVYGSAFSTQTEVKYLAWTQWFVCNYITILSIYMFIFILWSQKCIQDYIKRKIKNILSDLQVDSISRYLQNFRRDLEWNSRMPSLKFMIVMAIGGLIAFISISIIEY